MLADADGEYYLSMEYVHGQDLRQIMSALPSGTPLPLPLALTIVREVAAALDYAHTPPTRPGRL